MKLSTVILLGLLFIPRDVFAFSTNTNVVCDPLKIGPFNKSFELSISFDGSFEEMLKSEQSQIKTTFSDNKNLSNLKTEITNYNLFEEYTTTSGGFIPREITVKIYSVKLQLTSADDLDMESIGCVTVPTKDVVRYLICKEYSSPEQPN